MPKHQQLLEQATISFDVFRLSPTERLLSKEGKPIELGGRAFDILVVLAERAGQVVSKNELLDIVWPDTTVEEGSLRFHIASLRKAAAIEDKLTYNEPADWPLPVSNYLGTALLDAKRPQEAAAAF